MKKLENEILNALIDKYERSKLSTIGTKNTRSIKLTTADEVLNNYTWVDSYKYAEENDATIFALEDKGFIVSHFVKEHFDYLTLNLTKVDDIYLYLKRANPLKETYKVKEVLSHYHFDNFLNDFIVYCNEYIEEKKSFPKMYFSDSENLTVILDCLQALFSLQKEMKERDFSAKYLKDSKLFETIKRKVLKIIRDFDDCDNLDDNQLLALYNLNQNTSYALIKNKLSFLLNQQRIDLGKMAYEFSLSDEMIEKLVIIPSDVKKVITVENLTSFYSLQDDEALIIYLAGYHNHTKQNLLIKIYATYPQADYCHYGDIDAGGFWILVNLRQKTGIPFVPYNMGVEQLKAQKNNLKKLTSNDYHRLQAMKDDERFVVFKETIEYMLAKGVKLEQENLD